MKFLQKALQGPKNRGLWVYRIDAQWTMDDNVACNVQNSGGQTRVWFELEWGWGVKPKRLWRWVYTHAASIKVMDTIWINAQAHFRRSRGTLGPWKQVICIFFSIR
jgi:hypothetical protein